MRAGALAPIGLGVLLAACGDGGPPAVADAAPDAPVPDATPPFPDDVRFVIDQMTMPINADTANALGFDLDADGTVDNQLGSILSALITATSGRFNPQDSVYGAVDRGSILLLARLTPCESANCLSTYPGANPQPAPCTDPDDLTTCRQHLRGTGTFEIADGAPANEVVGTVIAGRFTGGPGTLFLQLAIAGIDPVDVDLLVARADLRGVDATGLDMSTIGGAIPRAQVDERVIPSVHAEIVTMIAEDCTGAGDLCGCVADSTGQTMLGFFDENADCAVTVEEFRGSSLIQTLFRSDVDTDADGLADALSVGVGISAVPASFP